MFGVGLHGVKNRINLGHVLRAADAFKASMVACTGARIRDSVTDVSKAVRRIPVLHGENLHALIPHACVPIAVELVEGAKNLTTYEHPKRAFYVFGAEDATLGTKVLSWCRDVIYIPTSVCLNLSACVNVVLYDRMAKERINNKGQDYDQLHIH